MHTTREQMVMTGNEDVLIFGPFRLDPVKRVLWEAGKPLRLGNRAFEILLALVERAGQLVGSNELLDRVWPNGAVEVVTLRVHIAALRKILGDGESGIRYVQNVSGRGYRFTAPVIRARAASPSTDPPVRVLAPTGGKSVAVAYRANNLPALLTRMVGRASVLNTLVQRMPRRRLVTITGPGGIGKTTLALSVAERLTCEYSQGVCFVDLALLEDPHMAPRALAAALGLAALTTDDPLSGILTFLRDKSILLVLDNCEHVIDVAASLAEKVLKGAPRVHILATSREPLRAEGESVHRLAALAMPEGRGAMTAVEALAFPAVQLFVERAEVSSDAFELTDADVPLVVEICRRFDGNPLAIELAAARVDLFGIKGLAASLDQGLHLCISGRRTSVPRHQTLRATLDWSHELLSPLEQALFRRLAVFAGSFDLLSADAVAVDEAVPVGSVFEGLTNLAAKSLLVVDVTGEKVLYRLLDMPRAYALEKLRDSDELTKTQRRHAEMWRTSGAAEIRAQRGADWLAVFGRRIDDLRAAIRWCFSPESDVPVGTRLTLASFWFECTLAAEQGGNREWAPHVLHIRPKSEAELLSELDAVLAEILPHLKGPVQDLTVAQELGGDGGRQRTALWGIWIERLILRDYRVANNISESFNAGAISSGDDVAMTSDQILTVAHHYAGRQSLARFHAERVLRGSGANATAVAGEALQLWHARAMLSRILWIQGFAEQAIRSTHDGVAGALGGHNPHLLCTTLIDAVAVALWCGDLAEARRFQLMLREYSVTHSLEYYHLWLHCIDTVLAVRSGEIAVDAELTLSDDPLARPQYLDLLGVLSEELVSSCSIVRAEHGRGCWWAPEILRVKGERMLKKGGLYTVAQVEAQFQTALDIARRQEALSWELRAALSLARLWRDQQRIGPARELLSSVYSRFTEGFETADLVAARTLLQELAACH